MASAEMMPGSGFSWRDESEMGGRSGDHLRTLAFHLGDKVVLTGLTLQGASGCRFCAYCSPSQMPLRSRFQHAA